MRILKLHHIPGFLLLAAVGFFGYSVIQHGNETSLTGLIAGGSAPLRTYTQSQLLNGVTLEADHRHYLSCPLSANKDIRDEDMGTAEAWIYEFTGDEPPFNGSIYVSPALRTYLPQAPSNTLQRFEAGKLYYILTDTDLPFRCDEGIIASVQCGDSTVSPGETCDDGNTQPGDGCSDACQQETGYNCDTPGSACKPLIPDLPSKTNTQSSSQSEMQSPSSSSSAMQSESSSETVAVHPAAKSSSPSSHSAQSHVSGITSVTVLSSKSSSSVSTNDPYYWTEDTTDRQREKQFLETTDYTVLRGNCGTQENEKPCLRYVAYKIEGNVVHLRIRTKDLYRPIIPVDHPETPNKRDYIQADLLQENDNGSYSSITMFLSKGSIWGTDPYPVYTHDFKFTSGADKKWVVKLKSGRVNYYGISDTTSEKTLDQLSFDFFIPPPNDNIYFEDVTREIVYPENPRSIVRISGKVHGYGESPVQVYLDQPFLRMRHVPVESDGTFSTLSEPMNCPLLYALNSGQNIYSKERLNYATAIYDRFPVCATE